MLWVGTPAAEVMFAARRWKAAVEAECVAASARRLYRVLWKANFNPNQPRVPKGSPEAGEWAKPAGPVAKEPTFDDVIGKIPLDPKLLEQLETAPRLPEERPTSRRSIIAAAKLAARWVVRRASVVADVVDGIRLLVSLHTWLQDEVPLILSYADPPKSHAELLEGARATRPGYDRHHIVEQNAVKDGIPAWQISSPDNIVSIPRIKHWELNSWYERTNPAYGGLTPREYLRGRGWTERFDVGEEGLREVGVLK